MQLFLCSLYVYSEKRKQWSIQISSDYHHIVLTLCQEKENGAEVSSMSIFFLEWRQDHVKPDVEYNGEYDDYCCLLAWLMVRRIINTFDQPEVVDVLNSLGRRRYNTEHLNTLSVSDVGMAPWLDLHLQLPYTEELGGISPIPTPVAYPKQRLPYWHHTFDVSVTPHLSAWPIQDKKRTITLWVRWSCIVDILKPPYLFLSE